jgi:hypothetical protein
MAWRPIGAYRLSEFAVRPRIQDDQPDPVTESLDLTPWRHPSR